MATDKTFRKAETHTVMESAAQSRFFTVISGTTGTEYTVPIKISCDCRYMAVQGIPNGLLCSHAIAVLQHILKKTQKNDRIHKTGM